MQRATLASGCVSLIGRRSSASDAHPALVTEMRLETPILVCGLGILALLCGCASERRDAQHEVTPLYSAASPQFRQSVGSLLGSSFVPGNRIVTLVNGREIFPAMLRAIRSAQRSINFETYIYCEPFGSTTRRT